MWESSLHLCAPSTACQTWGSTKNGKMTTDKRTWISLCGAWQCRGPRLPLPGQSGGKQGGDLRKSAMVHRAQLEALLSILDSHFLMEGSCQHSTSLSWWVQSCLLDRYFFIRRGKAYTDVLPETKYVWSQVTSPFRAEIYSGGWLMSQDCPYTFSRGQNWG